MIVVGEEICNYQTCERPDCILAQACKWPRYECHKLDDNRTVYFYEQDFYVLSNFSSFMVSIWGLLFNTSEHAYHWAKFMPDPEYGYAGQSSIQREIALSRSAHDAFKLGEKFKPYRHPQWDSIKVETMRAILRAKVQQHEYVKRKLLDTGERTLIEDSWRDDFWGWGPNKDGQNWLGKLWMEIRDDVQQRTTG